MQWRSHTPFNLTPTKSHCSLAGLFADGSDQVCSAGAIAVASRSFQSRIARHDYNTACLQEIAVFCSPFFELRGEQQMPAVEGDRPVFLGVNHQHPHS